MFRTSLEEIGWPKQGEEGGKERGGVGKARLEKLKVGRVSRMKFSGGDENKKGSAPPISGSQLGGRHLRRSGT